METDIEKLPEYLPHLDKDTQEKLTKYYQSLVYFNAKVNLVSSSSLPNAAKQHFSDSVLGLDLILAQESFRDTVYDFGSGNGFPGLVLAMMRPDVGVCLVEKDTRKSEFLKHIVADQRLSNVTIFNANLEKLEKNTITHGITRALGSIARVLIQANSLFVQGGSLYHFKSENWSSEIASCPTQLFSSWDIQQCGQYTLPDTTVQRFIISSIKK
jgi:16S rRNA (guanine527-N7)-methyltransferase